MADHDDDTPKKSNKLEDKQRRNQAESEPFNPIMVPERLGRKPKSEPLSRPEPAPDLVK